MEFIKKITKLYLSRGFWISGPQFFSIAAQLVTLPIVLQNIPADMYGAFQFAFSVVTWVTLLSVGNISLGAKRGIATDKLGTFVHAFLYRLRIVIPLGVLVVLVGYFLDSDRGIIQQLIMIVGAYLAIGYLPQVTFPHYFVARQQFKSHFVWQSVLYVLVPILATLTAVYTKDVRLFVIAQFGVISFVSIAALGWIFIRGGVVASYKRGEIDRGVIKYGFSMIPAEIAIGTSGQLSSFIIGPFFGFVNLAVYSIASRVDSSIRNFLASLYDVLYADFARKSFEELRTLLRSKLPLLFLISVLLSVVVAVPGFVYIKYAIPESFRQALVIFFILALGFPPVLLQTILQTFLASHLRHRALVFSGVIPNVIKIAIMILFGFLGGIVGVAIAVAVSAWVSYLFYHMSIFYKNFLFSLLPMRFVGGAFKESGNEEDSDI